MLSRTPHLCPLAIDTLLSTLHDMKVPISTALEFHGSLAGPANPIPVFRMLKTDGSGLVHGAAQRVPSGELLLAMYRTMVTTQAMDTVFYDSQRQGRFGFYMTCTGEEASIVGSAAALESDDVVRSCACDLPCLQGLPMHQGCNLCN